jgi:ribonuclease HI
MQTQQIKVFTDGGARGNPGPAAAGWVAFGHQGELISFDSIYLGDNTNNYAEYMALISALKFLVKTTGAKSSTKFLFHLDSELIVKQLKGEYKVKHPELQKLNSQVQGLLVELTAVEFVHVPRAQNKFADKLVNIVLDARS